MVLSLHSQKQTQPEIAVVHVPGTEPLNLWFVDNLLYLLTWYITIYSNYSNKDSKTSFGCIPSITPSNFSAYVWEWH